MRAISLGQNVNAITPLKKPRSRYLNNFRKKKLDYKANHKARFKI